MRDIGIYLNIGNKVEILACELDNEDRWYQLDDYTFESTNIQNLTLEINNDKYVYTLKGKCNVKLSIINLKTGEHLTDDYLYYDFIKQLCDMDENGDYIFNYNDTKIVFHTVRLITFKNRDTTIQIIM